MITSLLCGGAHSSSVLEARAGLQSGVGLSFGLGLRQLLPALLRRLVSYVVANQVFLAPNRANFNVGSPESSWKVPNRAKVRRRTSQLLNFPKAKSSSTLDPSTFQHLKPSNPPTQFILLRAFKKCEIVWGAGGQILNRAQH